MQKRYMTPSSSKFKLFEELSSLEVREITEMIKENRRNSSEDYESMMTRRMERLEEESRIMKRASELSYQQTLVHFDI